MADTNKTLAQSIPSASVLTDAYTVPGATSAVVSTILICNQSSSNSIFRISVAVAGAGDTGKQYLYYNIPIRGNDTFAATLGITLATTDIIRVYGGNGQISFNIFGIEIT